MRDHGLKGNRVKVPDSPAAVISIMAFAYKPMPLFFMKENESGKAKQRGESQKTCKTESHACILVEKKGKIMHF